MFFISSALLLIAWIWLIVIAIQEGQIIWGISMILLFFPCFIYGILYWKIAHTPFIILLVGMGLAFTVSPEEWAKYERS